MKNGTFENWGFVKVSKNRKQIFQQKVLPKNEPTNLFFYPDYYTYQDRKTNSMIRFLDEVLAWKFVIDFYWPLACTENNNKK